MYKVEFVLYIENYLAYVVRPERKDGHEENVHRIV
jgi:hypothetical protein